MIEALLAAFNEPPVQFEVFEQDAGVWRPRMVNRSSRSVSISRGRFSSEEDCRSALERVKMTLAQRIKAMDT